MIPLMTKTFIAVTLTALFLNGCVSSHPVVGPPYQYVPFSGKELHATNAKDIQIYHSRLELPGPFEEIGVIKLEGPLSNDEMKAVAAIHGADGIVLEGMNALLIELTQKPKEDGRKNDTKET